MRIMPILLLVSALIAVAALAVPERGSQPQPQPELRSYVLHLTEFRAETPLDPGVTAEQIVGAFQHLQAEGRLEAIRTVSLSILEGHDGRAQFGDQVPVVGGVSRSGAGTQVSSVSWQEFGVIVEAKVSREPAGTVLSLKYEASRYKGKDDDGVSLGSARTQLETALLIEPNTVRLVGGISEDDSHYLLVTLEQ